MKPGSPHLSGRPASRPSSSSPSRGVGKRSANEKRAYIRHHRPRGLSVVKGCQLTLPPRSTLHDVPAAPADEAEIIARMRAICEPVRRPRLSSCRRCAAPPGGRRQRQEDLPADARARPAAEASAAVRRHHRQRSRSPDLPGPSQGYGRRRSEPALGRRHHLHRDRGRLRLSRRHPRCLVTPGGRLCDQRFGRRPTGAGRLQSRPPCS